LDEFFKLLDDESIINAMHTAGLAGKIARAKPELMARNMEKHLSEEKTQFDKSRQDLISSYVLDSFDQLFLESDDKDNICKFAMKHLDCGSQRVFSKVDKIKFK